MGKRTIIIICMMFLLAVFQTGCTKNDKRTQNFLGGYGQIENGAFADTYESPFFEDDVYIYYRNLKINKNTKKWINLCEKPGCTHGTADCIQYMHAGHVFPAEDKIYFADGKKLYTINTSGEKEYVAEFSKDCNGVSLADDVNIGSIQAVSENVIYVSCQQGSCFFNIETGDKLYVYTYEFCGDEGSIYYYDDGIQAVVKVDTRTLVSHNLMGTKGVYPRVIKDGKLYCDTDAGAVCCIDNAGNIELIKSSDKCNYTLISVYDDRLYYLESDSNQFTGEGTYCNLCSSMLDGSDEINKAAQGINPEMAMFAGDQKIFFLDTDYDGYGGIKSVSTFSFVDDSYNEYPSSISSDTDLTGENNSEMPEPNEDSETQDEKSFAIGSAFYASVKDELTGKDIYVKQDKEPFIIDGSENWTTFYTNVEVNGYPEEGYIYIFVMCDGKLQMSQVENEKMALISKVRYKNKKDMYVKLGFELGNSSPDNKIVIGFYLSDFEITDNYEEFSKYRETVTTKEFRYRLADGYSLDNGTVVEEESKYETDDVYTYEDQENRDTISGTIITAISDDIPIKRQKERWRVCLSDASKCKVILCADYGTYDIYAIVDDAVMPLSGEGSSIRCNITGDNEAVVFTTDMESVLWDGQPHKVKILVNDRQTGRLGISSAQIIEKRD
ncbi:MAG: hypothetical protein J6A82_00750 [Coprococcus sp.]|nr:hypothetical protein [Coprococcus sp.]